MKVKGSEKGLNLIRTPWPLFINFVLKTFKKHTPPPAATFSLFLFMKNLKSTFLHRMQRHGSLEGVEIKKAGWRLGFFLQGVWAKIQGSSI